VRQAGTPRSWHSKTRRSSIPGATSSRQLCRQRPSTSTSRPRPGRVSPQRRRRRSTKVASVRRRSSMPLQPRAQRGHTGSTCSRASCAVVWRRGTGAVPRRSQRTAPCRKGVASMPGCSVSACVRNQAAGGSGRCSGAVSLTSMQTACNPILPGFHPDPSLCRVGDDFYLATSTFEWWPGVRLHHSLDLVHWRPLPGPLTRRSQLDLAGVPDSGGIWAPCL